MGGYSFEDLEVYQYARIFRMKMYKLSKKLPPEEKYNLSDQIRRASVSLTSNIAEGRGRFHYQENIQFLGYCRGSLTELLDDVNTCIDEEYADLRKLNEHKREGFELMLRINGVHCIPAKT